MIYMLRGKDSMPRVRHKISLVVESFALEKLVSYCFHAAPSYICDADDANSGVWRELTGNMSG